MNIEIGTLRLFIRQRRDDLNRLTDREVYGRDEELNVLEMFLDNFEKLKKGDLEPGCENPGVPMTDLEPGAEQRII